MKELGWLRYLLFPISLLYGLVMILRNWMYQQGLLKSVSFDVPVISVGNLSVGGTGKTPHIAYIAQMLSPFMPLASLSRGYGRKSRGFKLVRRGMASAEVGDESLWMTYKFPQMGVAVSEDRATGIPLLLSAHPETKAVLLDDAFQHRSVSPYINILLTTYQEPYYRDWLIPTGRLREFASERRRADLIIVTKCPTDLPQEQRTAIKTRLKPDGRPVFFTYYHYVRPYLLTDAQKTLVLDEQLEAIVLTAIADTEYLNAYLDEHIGVRHSYTFRDHHEFSKRDIGQLKLMYDDLDATRKAIICTEKDAVRLLSHSDYIRKHQLPIYVLAIGVQFLGDGAQQFETWMQAKLLAFKA